MTVNFRISNLNLKIKNLAKSCFKNDDFGFDFIKKIIISIILKKPYYITVHETHVNSLKSIFKMFANFNYFNIDMRDVDTINDIIGYQNDDGDIETIGFSPNSNIVFLDNIWSTGNDITRNLIDLVKTNKYTINNVMIDSFTKIFIGSSGFSEKPSAKYSKLWDLFFIKDQYMTKIEGIDELLDLESIDLKSKINNNDLNFIMEEYDSIRISRKILEIIVEIKNKIIIANKPFESKNSALENLIVDDDAWDNIIRSIKLSAFLEGRENIEIKDLNIIIPIVSSMPIHYDLVTKIINEVVNHENINQNFSPTKSPKITRESIMNKLTSDISNEVNKIDQAVNKLEHNFKNNKDKRTIEIKRKIIEVRKNILNEQHPHSNKPMPYDPNIINNILIQEMKMSEINKVENAKHLLIEEKQHESDLKYIMDDKLMSEVEQYKSKIKYIADDQVVTKVEKITINTKTIETMLPFSNKPKIFDENNYLNRIKNLLDDKSINTELKSKTAAKANEIEDFSNILLNSYNNYREMIFIEVKPFYVKKIDVIKKTFTNFEGTYYLATDDNDNNYMFDKSGIDLIDSKKVRNDVLFCSKEEFMDSYEVLLTKSVYWDMGQYFIKLLNGKKSKITFSLSESQRDLIFPNLISIPKLQKIIKESEKLIDHFDKIILKIKKIFSNENVDSKNYENSINILSDALLVKVKISSFLKWIKNSNDIQASVKIFLPEYSEI